MQRGKCGSHVSVVNKFFKMEAAGHHTRVQVLLKDQMGQHRPHVRDRQKCADQLHSE